MTVMQRVVKPRNQKAKRALEDREPKSIENTKKALFIKGLKCSDRLQRCMKDLCLLKKPFSEHYNQKNDIRPMEDATKIEGFGKKEDASLFLFGNHNKKRPDNLIMGRLYDGHILDMMEMGLEGYRGLQEFKNEKVTAEIKPCLLFSGEAFEKSEEMKRLKSLLIDFFRGPEVTNVRLAGVEHALQFTAAEEDGESKYRVFVRSYRIVLKKSSTPKVPRVELEEIGPSLDLTLRRSHLASEDLFKTSCKQVKNVYKPKKVKNKEADAFGSTLGRVHMQAQDVNKVQTRKMKGLKEERKERLMNAKKEKAENARKKAVEEVFADDD